MATTDSWTCPRCQNTWTRNDQTRDEWTRILRWLQETHGARYDRSPIK